MLKSRKTAAWTDASDPPLVSLTAPRLRKLRDAPAETTLSGREYETRLRRQYERINPEPSWASKARKTQRTDVEHDGEVGENDVRDLLSSTAGILAPSNRKAGAGVVLPKGTLAIERLRDANQATQGSGSGEVKAVAFHPSERVPVLCVGTADRRIRLYNVTYTFHFKFKYPNNLIDRRPHLSPSSDTSHPFASAYLPEQRNFPPPWFFSSPHRPTSIFLHA